jgi:hypothetical protein
MVFKKKFALSPEGRYISNIYNPKIAQAYIKQVLEEYKERFTKYVPGTFEGFIIEMPGLVPSSQGIPWDDDLVSKYRSKYKKDMLKIIPALFTPVIEKEAKNRIHLYNYMAASMYERFVSVLETWAKRFRLSQWVLCPEKSLYTEDNVFFDSFAIPSAPLTTVGIQNQDGLQESFAFHRALADINATEYRRETITVVGRSRQGLGASIQSLRTEIEQAAACGSSQVIVDGCFFNLSHHNYLRTPFNPSWYYPGWAQMQHFSDYSARLQTILQGVSYNRSVAVLLPSQAMLAEFTPADADESRKTALSLRRCLESLRLSKISFDVISEDRLLACAVKANGEFGAADRIRKGSYQALIIPSSRLISKSLFVFIEKVAIKKGTVIIADEVPQGNFDDGILASFTERLEKLLTSKKEFIHVTPAKEVVNYLDFIAKPFDVLTNNKSCPDIEGVHGSNSDHELFVFVNTAEKKDFFTTISLPGAAHVYYADCTEGEVYEIKDAVATESGLDVNLSFAPLQCYTLLATQAKLSLPAQKKNDEHVINVFATVPRSYRIVLKDQWTFTPESLNAMPLANWSTRIGLSRESGSFSHFSESYFEVKEVPTECILLFCGALLDGDRSAAPYEISVNGAVIEPHTAGAAENVPVWDRFCGPYTLKYDIKDFLIKGFNRVAIRTMGINGNPQPILFPPIIAGSFSISKGQKGWTIDVPTALVGYDSWTRHGFPYLSGSGVYSQKFEVPSERNRVVLSFSQTSGPIDVKVNDVDMGTLIWQPMEIDITGKCEQKRNDLTVRVVNTMDNLLRMNSRPSGLIGEAYLDVYEDQ